MPSRRFLVSGRVQGVAYRAWTVDQAEGLGLNGWARNLADRRVEVVACGNRDAVEALRSALSSGPPAAKVITVEETTVDADASRGITGFCIR